MGELHTKKCTSEGVASTATRLEELQAEMQAKEKELTALSVVCCNLRGGGGGDMTDMTWFQKRDHRRCGEEATQCELAHFFAGMLSSV